MPEDEAITMDQVKDDLSRAIQKLATHESGASVHAGAILVLSEAYAWIAVPNMPHGGSALTN